MSSCRHSSDCFLALVAVRLLSGRSSRSLHPALADESYRPFIADTVAAVYREAQCSIEYIHYQADKVSGSKIRRQAPRLPTLRCPLTLDAVPCLNVHKRSSRYFPTRFITARRVHYVEPGFINLPGDHWRNRRFVPAGTVHISISRAN
jgi:hypothetical protein